MADPAKKRGAISRFASARIVGSASNQHSVPVHRPSRRQGVSWTSRLLTADTRFLRIAREVRVASSEGRAAGRLPYRAAGNRASLAESRACSTGLHFGFCHRQTHRSAAIHGGGSKCSTASETLEAWLVGDLAGLCCSQLPAGPRSVPAVLAEDVVRNARRNTLQLQSHACVSEDALNRSILAR